jgi:hypothetical protein
LLGNCEHLRHRECQAGLFDAQLSSGKTRADSKALFGCS